MSSYESYPVTEATVVSVDCKAKFLKHASGQIKYGNGSCSFTRDGDSVIIFISVEGAADVEVRVPWADADVSDEDSDCSYEEL